MNSIYKETAMDASKYPEGYEAVKSMLGFLPEVDEVRDGFMLMLMEIMVQG